MEWSQKDHISTPITLKPKCFLKCLSTLGLSALVWSVSHLEIANFFHLAAWNHLWFHFLCLTSPRLVFSLSVAHKTISCCTYFLYTCTESLFPFQPLKNHSSASLLTLQLLPLLYFNLSLNSSHSSPGKRTWETRYHVTI